MSASFAVVLQTKKLQPQYKVHAQFKWKSHPLWVEDTHRKWYILLYTAEHRHVQV